MPTTSGVTINFRLTKRRRHKAQGAHKCAFSSCCCMNSVGFAKFLIYLGVVRMYLLIDVFVKQESFSWVVEFVFLILGGSVN